MTKDEFAVGDVVTLKSGGPDMTIQSKEGDHIWAQWFGDRKLEHGRFPVASLFVVPKKKEI